MVTYEFYTTEKQPRPKWMVNLIFYGIIVLLSTGVIAGSYLGIITLVGSVREPLNVGSETLNFGTMYPSGSYTTFSAINNSSPNNQTIKLELLGNVTNPSGVKYTLNFNSTTIVPPNTNIQIPIQMVIASDSPVGDISINLNKTRI